MAALAGNTANLNDVGAATSTAELGAATSVVGMVDTIYATMNLWFDADAGRYPTQLTAISARAMPTEFNEDFEEPGEVSNVEITAASTGFDAAEALGKIGTAAANAVAGMVSGKAKNGMTFSRVENAFIFAGEKLRDTATAQLISELGEEYGSFCPDTWTVQATDPDYVKVEGVIGRIKADEQAMTYEPKMLGDDIVRVSSRPGVFSGQEVIIEFPTTTKQLRVIATPEEHTVRSPGDTVNIDVRLENADNEDLEWDAGPGEWEDGLGDTTDSGRRRPLKTPEDESEYPFQVVVTSASKTGLREEATDVRNDSVTIRIAGLFVDPDPGYVLAGQSLQFTATDREGQTRASTWTASGGTIDRDGGTYTAGREPGEYTVTASAVDDPEVKGTATVIVGDGDGDCFIGRWLLRSADFVQQIQDTAGPGVPGQFTYLSGDYLVEFDPDGSARTIRDPWELQIQSEQGALTMTFEGVDTATWTVLADGTATGSSVSSSTTVSLTVNMNGQQIPVPFGQDHAVETNTLGFEPDVECDGDLLTTTANGITAIFDRVS